jgi:hypothetical protein
VDRAADGLRLLAADAFVDRYKCCACEQRCRNVDVDLTDLVAARQTLSKREGHPVLLPDLRQQGFELDGVCECFGEPDVDVVHAFYRKPGPEPVVVSFFSLDQKVHLKDCTCEKCTRADGLPRDYEVAHCKDVIVCKWDETANSFVVCSEMDRSELRDLANSVAVASLRCSPTAFVRGD